MKDGLLLRFALFFGTVTLLVCGLTYRLLSRRLGLGKRGNRLLLAFLLCSGVLMIWGPVSYRALEVSATSLKDYFLQWTQFFLLGWVGSVFLIFIFFEIIQAASKPFDPRKRIFLTEGVSRGLLAAGTASSFFGLLEANAGPAVHEVPITLPTLPKSFDGFRVAQISDVHVGPLIHRDYLENVVARVMALKADAIFITGDLVDGTVDQLREEIEPLRKLSARHGVYFCTGNHEYYSGVHDWIAHLESMSIQVLKNSNRVITQSTPAGDEHLMIAGVYDHNAYRYDSSHQCVPALAAKSDLPVSCKILLAHNPFSIKEAVAAGFDLQVSGHTHAGQFYPYTFIVKTILKYSEGLYRVNDKTQIYVNRGTGYWGPPNRLGKRSEITHLTLKSGRGAEA
jgi:predicted MPP superfamily phosphohydrolase